MVRSSTIFEKAKGLRSGLTDLNTKGNGRKMAHGVLVNSKRPMGTYMKDNG